MKLFNIVLSIFLVLSTCACSDGTSNTVIGGADIVVCTPSGIVMYNGIQTTDKC